MNNLITATEAFDALLNGFTVMCRPIGDMLDFSDLGQFPATVFAQPNYEFCIQRETTVLAEIQFTKPVEPHDLKDGQDIYIVMPSHILRTTYNSKHGETCLSVGNGFAQLDEENAKLQLQAIGKAFGNMITDIQVIDVTKDKPRGQKSKQVKAELPAITEKPTEIVAAEDQTAIVITKQTNVTASVDLLIQPSVESAIKPNNYDDLLQSVQNAHTPEEVNSVITYTSKWTEEQRKPLLTEMHKRLSELKQTRQQENELSPLILRLQHAVDLKMLEELELEIPSRHADVHKTLWNMAKKRRAQLNAASNESDYLLEEPF
ncbi:hypothetical protein [Acinetobacter pittii]|uniref:hypothetical protein n=1 Tax=Acinetobacter pittii TaxID=48296 RepID=UPI001EE4F137|nr:hypothetical protein [Acinetobacter pittii]MCG5226763.1 hypothetical protein [Acinetobacter pittii]